MLSSTAKPTTVPMNLWHQPITPRPHIESNTIEHGQIHKSNYHKVQTHITTNKNPHTIPKLSKPQITKPRIRSHLTNHKTGNLNPRIQSHLWYPRIQSPCRCPRIQSYLNSDAHNPVSHRLELRGESSCGCKGEYALAEWTVAEKSGVTVKIQSRNHIGPFGPITYIHGSTYQIMSLEFGYGLGRC